MRYMILDEETQIHQGFKRKANPFIEANYIVYRGWKFEGDERCSIEYYPDKDSVTQIDIPDDVDVIVAHNAKFELLYEKRFSPDTLHAFFKRGGRIWCTQYAEYLLQAQQQKWHMATLEAVCKLYGGKPKVDGVKLLWEQGVQTSDIDRDLITDYLIGTEEEGRNGGDIGNTELAYLGQIEMAEDLGMMQAIKLRMDGLAATSEMEFNGLQIDVKRAKQDLVKRTQELKEADKKLAEYMDEFFPLPDGYEFGWGSPTQKSCLLFGGTVRYKKSDTYIDENTGKLARFVVTERWPLFDGEPVDPAECLILEDGLHCRHIGNTVEPQDVFLSGKKKGEPKFKNVKGWGDLKTKIQDFYHTFPGITEPADEWKSKLTDAVDGPVYGSGADIVEVLAKRDIPFLKALGDKTRLDKEIGTYYYRIDSKGNKGGMLTCVQPWDHKVHHKLNHTSTVTTRLSSSDPNLQNVTRADYDKSTDTYKSEVKAMFISRFGDEGDVAEIDYSQLEVVVQGLLTRDTNLIRDLNDKVDFHCKRVALKNSVSYDFALFHCKTETADDHDWWKNERQNCKSFSFERAFGAGAKGISTNNNIPLEDVERMIEVEEAEYPGINKFHEGVAAEVNATAEPFHDAAAGYRAFRRGTWQSPTGTMFSWRSYDAKAWQKKKGIMDTFKPTEMKNYPIQGTAGELVQMVLGLLWRWFVKNDNFGGKAFLTNTVHDCVWADTHKDVRDRVIAGMIKIMEAIPHFLKRFFNIDCPVSFPVEAEYGPNMLELQHWQEPNK